MDVTPNWCVKGVGNRTQTGLGVVRGVERGHLAKGGQSTRCHNIMQARHGEIIPAGTWE